MNEPSLFDIDSEMNTVGALMILPEVLADISYLTPSDFHNWKCGTIFLAILELNKRKVEINPNTVSDELERTRHLKGIGGPAFLTRCWNLSGTYDASRYAPIVKDFSLRRQMICKAQREAARALALDIPVFQGGDL